MVVKRMRQRGSVSAGKAVIVDAHGKPAVFPTKTAAMRAARGLARKGRSRLGKADAVEAGSGWIVARRTVKWNSPSDPKTKKTGSTPSTSDGSPKAPSGKKVALRSTRALRRSKSEQASGGRNSAARRSAPSLWGSRKRRKGGEVDWDLFVATIRPGSSISVRIDGDVSEADALSLEMALRDAVGPRGLGLRREAVSWGSWRARFVAFLSRHFGEADVETAKRSAEVRLVAVPDSGAQKAYSEGLATLVSTISNLPNDAVLMTEGYLVVKVDGEVIGRQLSQKESSAYRRGDLTWILESPRDAMALVTRIISVDDAPIPALTDGHG